MRNFFKTFFIRLKEGLRGLPYSGLLSGWLQALGRSGTMDYYTSWVYACVQRRSEGLARAKFKLYKLNKKKEIEEVEDHEVLSLLSKFNPLYTRYDSIILTSIYQDMYGSSPWVLFREDNSQKISEIWIAHPEHMKPYKKDELGNVTAWLYQIGTYKQEIPAKDVLYLRNPDPSNPAKGRSILSAVKTVAEIDHYAKEWNKNLMKNDARPSIALEYPDTITEAERKRLKEMFAQEYAGYKNSYKALVLGGGAKVNPFTIPPKDLEFSQGRIENREEIAIVFGVPQSILGVKGTYTRADAEVAERVFARYTLEPKLTQITEQINEFLIPEYDDNLWLSFEPLVPEDREQKFKEYEQGWNKFFTTNEVRQDLGLEPVDGGDFIYMPLTNVPVMTGGESKTMKIIKLKLKNKGGVNLTKQAEIRKKILARNHKRNKMADDIASRFIKKLKDKKKSKQPVLRIVELKGMSDEKKREWWEMTAKAQDRLDECWRKALTIVFTNQEKIILDNLKKQKKGRGRKGLVDDVMFDEAEQIKATMTIIEPEYYRSVMVGAGIAADLIDKPIVDITNIPAVQKWIKKITEKYSTDITKVTIEKVSKLLEEGIVAGESIGQLGDRVEDLFKNMTPVRADRIARTESARAMTAGSAYEWERYGLTEVEWYAEPDACPICVNLSQQELWTIKDAKMSTVHYSHPNCRCRWLAKV